MQVIEDLKTDLTNLLNSKFAEIQSEIKKQGTNTPEPNKFNTSQISHEIKGHLESMSIRVDDSVLISALRDELKKHDRVLSSTKDEIANLSSMAHESIRAVRSEKLQEVNVRLSLQKDFYGFTGWRPFAIYIATLSLALSFAGYSWVKNSDDERLIEAQTKVSEFQKRVEILRVKNPKVAKRYFY